MEHSASLVDRERKAPGDFLLLLRHRIGKTLRNFLARGLGSGYNGSGSPSLPSVLETRNQVNKRIVVVVTRRANSDILKKE